VLHIYIYIYVCVSVCKCVRSIAENADGLGPAQVWAWVQAFVAEVKALTGKPCLMYTGYYFWRDQVGNPSTNLGCPLWIASYTSSPGVPSAWAGWTFWQYNDNGQLPGIAGNVDVDYFQGSESDLKNLCF
jgi:lysozyme